MRCPYCGGYNADQANFCARCGRDLKVFPPPNQQNQGFPPPPQARPTNLPPSQQAQQTPQVTQRRRPSTVPAQPARVSREQDASIIKPEPPPPEPPSQFPPQTVEQLRALEEGALTYTVFHSTEGDGHKKIVRIVYPKCVNWQQVATLFKAFKEQLEGDFDTIVIQGVFAQDPDVYEFTNGQLEFDHEVRLGDMILNRYQIETGNGFEADSMRIVITE